MTLTKFTAPTAYFNVFWWGVQLNGSDIAMTLDATNSAVNFSANSPSQIVAIAGSSTGNKVSGTGVMAFPFSSIDGKTVTLQFSSSSYLRAWGSNVSENMSVDFTFAVRVPVQGDVEVAVTNAEPDLSTL